jgi:Na+-transporting NADH:ubiquinone oxidoreductase subunit NqrB
MEDRHRAGIAAVLSFLFNGLGQIYNGNIKKGLAIIFLSAISMLMILIGTVLLIYWIKMNFFSTGLLSFGLGLFLLGTIFACVIGVRCIYDAYNGK